MTVRDLQHTAEQNAVIYMITWYDYWLFGILRWRQKLLFHVIKDKVEMNKTVSREQWEERKKENKIKEEKKIGRENDKDEIIWLNLNTFLSDF